MDPAPLQGRRPHPRKIWSGSHLVCGRLRYSGTVEWSEPLVSWSTVSGGGEDETESVQGLSHFPNKVTQQPHLVSCRVRVAQEESGLELLILTLTLYFQSYTNSRSQATQAIPALGSRGKMGRKKSEDGQGR